MSSIKWRFPPSNYGENKGINDGDTETFKKRPVEAFAREVLQNSIDARFSDEMPVVVEFREFNIKNGEIPNCCGLRDSINRCIKYWAHKEDYKNAYQEMLDILEKPEIACLRVSDYNTTGLIGVNSKEHEKNKFLALTKGTGVSEKTGLMAGGSKGVGKNAAFLMSSLRTVIYSTNANQDVNGEKGCFKGAIGVAEFVSGYVDDNENCEQRDHTQGTGYLSIDEFNNPLSDIICLDNSKTDRSKEPGTDMYILGFKRNDEWESEVINSILDSFMVAIVRGELEVRINNHEISKSTIQNIIYNEQLIFDKQKANFVSQYRLLTDKNVGVYDIETDYGNCSLYVLSYNKSEERYVTYKCAMIRYPLMKIKDRDLSRNFKVSAMCIIENNKLGKLLRDIENPQHIDWEPKRISEKNKRKEMQNVIRDMYDKINEKVMEYLKVEDNSSLDPNGAGDFLPDASIGDEKTESSQNTKSSETAHISKIKYNSITENKTTIKNDNGSGLEPDIGDVDENIDGLVQYPIGENNNDDQGRHPGTERGGEKEGDNIIFKQSKLSGVRYKVISTDKNNGKIRVIFVSPRDDNNCYLQIKMLDDCNTSKPINIISMKVNGSNVCGSNPHEFGPFSIQTNKKIVLDVITDAKGFFGSEVKVICK